MVVYFNQGKGKELTVMTMPTRIYTKEYKGHKMRVISQGYAQIVQIDDYEPQHFTDTQTGAIYYCHQEIDKMTK